MQQNLKSGWGVIRRNSRLAFLFALSLMLSCCSDSPTQPMRAPRNIFPDYQHISGYVSGVWTKEHNPYVITGEVYIGDGDSLGVTEGVQILTTASINVKDNGILKLEGSLLSPVRVLLGYSGGGGIYAYEGKIRISRCVFEGHGKNVSVGYNSKIEHANFSESILEYVHTRDVGFDSIIVRNCIFAGYRPWKSQGNRAQFSTWNGAVLDSSKLYVLNNLFFTGIGDSTWLIAPDPIVDVWVQGRSGRIEIYDLKYPLGNNLFGDPKWASYTFVGLSASGISDNDYHLQPGSPAIGAASDGTNIGAY